MPQDNTQITSDTELNAFIEENRKKAENGTITIIIGIIIRVNAKKAIKECMTQAVLLPTLNEIFDNVEYSAKEHISSDIIKNTNIGFSFKMDSISGSDYIKAEYKGVDIEMSDITIKSTQMDSDGNNYERIEFQGLWLMCDFHKNFSADVLLRERSKGEHTKSSVETENESFNKQFVIRSRNPHDVFYILTPNMMEYIQEMDRRADARSYMLFEKTGKLYLALDSRRDAFEVKHVETANAEELRKQFVSEVQYVVELIDALRLVKTLHKADR